MTHRKFYSRNTLVRTETPRQGHTGKRRSATKTAFSPLAAIVGSSGMELFVLPIVMHGFANLAVRFGVFSTPSKILTTSPWRSRPFARSAEPQSTFPTSATRQLRKCSPGRLPWTADRPFSGDENRSNPIGLVDGMDADDALPVLVEKALARGHYAADIILLGGHHSCRARDRPRS